jgi:branched-chain amino acid transport system substrate-binding protein
VTRCVTVVLAAALLCTLSPLRTAAAAEAPYSIYAILPLTGPNAFAGSEEREAFGVLESTVNRGGGVRGRSIHFEVVDSQSSPQIAVQLAGGLLTKQLPLIIGDSSVATCNAMGPLFANGPGTLQFCLSPGFEPTHNGNGYVVGHSPQQFAGAILRYFRARGWRRIAFLLAFDATGDSVLASFNAQLGKSENRDLTAVAIERFNGADISVAAQLAKIRSAGAQAIVAFNSGSPFGLILRGLRDTDFDLPVMTSQGNLSYVEMRQFADILPRQLFFASGPLPPIGVRIADASLRASDEAFLDAFGRQGIKPDWGHAVAWDTGSIIVAALRARGVDATSSDIRSYINGLRDFPGIQGLIDFRTFEMRGVSDVRILQWNKAQGTWAIVSQKGGIPKS